MKIKGIIFDKDGTLIRYDELWIPAAEHAAGLILDKLGADGSLAGAMLREIGARAGISGLLCRGTYRQISEAFGGVLEKAGTVTDAEELYTLTCEAFRMGAERGRIVPVCDGLGNVLKRLRAGGIKLFLVTTDEENITRRCLDSLGIDGMFDGIYTDDGKTPSKPDPYYINKIMSEYGFKPEELIMVGDTMTDIEFAENGGIRAVGVAASGEDRRILEKGAAAVIENVSQLEKVLNEI